MGNMSFTSTFRIGIIVFSYHQLLTWVNRCDVSLLSGARALASSLAQQLPKINLLVLSPGILSMNGRTETTEGHDVKMVLHYYTRALFIDSLVPNLKAATDAKEDARVMSVLDSLRGDYKKVLWDDLDLKKSYTLGNAAQHCMAFTDVAVQVSPSLNVKPSCTVRKVI